MLVFTKVWVYISRSGSCWLMGTSPGVGVRGVSLSCAVSIFMLTNTSWFNFVGEHVMVFMLVSTSCSAMSFLVVHSSGS